MLKRHIVQRQQLKQAAKGSVRREQKCNWAEHNQLVNNCQVELEKHHKENKI